MVSVVKPGSCLANSTVLMMHLVDSSLNLSQRLTSRETRCSELLFCEDTGETRARQVSDFDLDILIKQIFLHVCVCLHGGEYRGVFPQLTQGGERVLVRPANSLDHLLRVGRQDVDLRVRRPLLFLLFLRPVVAHHCWRGWRREGLVTN